MVDITIDSYGIHGAYKPSYNWGPHPVGTSRPSDPGTVALAAPKFRSAISRGGRQQSVAGESHRENFPGTEAVRP